MQPHNHEHCENPHATPPPHQAIDPICGMTVDPANAKGGSYTHEGETHYFCSPKCREKFIAQTKTPQPPAPSPQPPAVTYTCPMHPEVVRDGPGSCPICGMALEPMSAEVEDD